MARAAERGGGARTVVGLRVEQAVDHDERVQQHDLRQVLLACEAEAQQVVAQVVSARDARHGHRVEDGGEDVLGARDLVVALADDALEQQARRVHHRHRRRSRRNSRKSGRAGD